MDILLGRFIAKVELMEQYGIENAKIVRGVFEATTDIVDVDDTSEADTPRLVIAVDRQRAAALG